MAERLRQDIAFPAGASLGISVDEGLKVRRVNDPDSRAIKAARYGVVHWTVVEVDAAAVSTKSDLVKALQSKTTGDVRVTFESPENRAPQASPLALKRTLDAIGGDEATFDVVSAACAFSATIARARARNDALFFMLPLDVLFD